MCLVPAVKALVVVDMREIVDLQHRSQWRSCRSRDTKSRIDDASEATGEGVEDHRRYEWVASNEAECLCTDWRLALITLHCDGAALSDGYCTGGRAGTATELERGQCVVCEEMEEGKSSPKERHLAEKTYEEALQVKTLDFGAAVDGRDVASTRWSGKILLRGRDKSC